MLKSILIMISDCRYGMYITMAGLDTLFEIMELNECFPTKRAQCQELVGECKIGSESGIEIIEQLILDNNVDIKTKAMDLLEHHFDYDTSFFQEAFGEEIDAFRPLN